MGEVIEVNSTRDQIEEFKESVLWKDIVRELEAWAEGFGREQVGLIGELERDPTMSSAHVIGHMADLHGRINAVMYFEGILDRFLEHIEERGKEETNNQQEVSDE